MRVLYLVVPDPPGPVRWRYGLRLKVYVVRRADSGHVYAEFRTSPPCRKNISAPGHDYVGGDIKVGTKINRVTVRDEKNCKPVNVADVLREAEADVLVNFLPVGSYEATRHHAQAALDVGCAFVNCMPEFVVSDRVWGERFKAKGLPAAGDDVKSQLGATILHRNLVRLCVDRGVKIEETYQLNLGGNTDFQNMTVEERLKTKRISKTEAVTSMVPYDVPTRIGPSDYVPFLGDKKICYVFIKGRKFGNMPVTITGKLEVEDSPNSAGVVIDVVRAVKLALDRGIGGPLISISSYAFKHPPVQVPDDVARQWVEDFIAGKREV